MKIIKFLYFIFTVEILSLNIWCSNKNVENMANINLYFNSLQNLFCYF